MQIFYTPDITLPTYQLNEEESKHAVRVLRLKEGDVIQLIDGKGGFYEGEISLANSKACEVNIIKEEKEYGKRNHYLHIAISPTKNIERIEWFLEKATEIGIDEVTFLETKNTERTKVKLERLEKVIVSAAKQSIKAYLPKLNDLTSYKTFIKEYSSSKEEKYIAHCFETEKVELKASYKSGEKVTILIGPEGDFSREEVEYANKNGFVSLTLGTSRLRTETAALKACMAINFLNE